MQRRAINPWEWSLQYGFSHGELVEGHRRTLYCAGQVARSANGDPVHQGDIAAQFELSLDNLDAVLDDGGMSLADVVRLTIYTTDVDALQPHYDVLTDRLDAAGVRPAQSLVGVSRLALPELLVEVEATAVQ